MENQNLSVLSLKWTETTEMKQIRYFPIGHIQTWHQITFYQNILKYFSDFWNRNFSILWLKWTQKIKMEKYQTFFHGIYSNVTPFLSKHFKVFQWLSKSKFLIFMTKVNPNRGNETKSDIFLWDIFKIWHHFSMVKKY